MKEFIITLLFGWLGVHKFMQKKYVLGIVYFFTLGLFGFGWAIDTILALVKMMRKERPKEDARELAGKRLVKSFDTVIENTYAKSDKYPDEKREDQIYLIRKNEKLELEFWSYKGAPMYYVCRYGTDIGTLRAGLAKILYNEYKDCEMHVTALERALDDKHDCMTCNIRIDLYTQVRAEVVDDSLPKQGNENDYLPVNGKTPLKSIDAIIVGTFAECALDEELEREDIIKQIHTNSKLSLKYWEYEGEPAYYVLNSKGMDAGCVRASLAKVLHDEYKDCRFEVTATGKCQDEYGNDTLDIRIDIYK